MLSTIVGVVCLLWYVGIAFAGALGGIQIFRHYRRRLAIASCETLSDEHVPHITIIRPVKGLEPDLYKCLATTFRQTYPRSKLTIFFCVSSRDDPALPTLKALLRDFPGFDVHLTIDEEDSQLQARRLTKDFGPNPKIGNISRAYREAKGDILWILDCNVWVSHSVAGRMVDKLCGHSSGSPYKFVHQLPLVVDITGVQRQQGLLDQPATTSTFASSTVSHDQLDNNGIITNILSLAGGRLEETFLTSSHAKFYVAINTVALAPCILGKSNMFRRSHLNALTEGHGTDYFSYNICEDHLLGDLLWRQPVPPGIAAEGFGSDSNLENNQRSPIKWGNHGLVFGDLAVQPIASMSISEYVARRVRWLRVRKFTVTVATLVEPGTESFLCSAYGAWAVTTLPQFERIIGVPPTWTAFALFWLLSICAWATADRFLYCFLMSMSSTDVDQDTPSWARGTTRCDLRSWVLRWIGREALALPIWLWAVWGGTTVVWRGNVFKVGMDMRVTALNRPMLRSSTISRTSSRSSTPLGTVNGNGFPSIGGKKRRE